MEIAYAAWLSFLSVIAFPIYTIFIRPYFLKRFFKKQVGDEGTFVQWSSEEGHFPKSKFMEQDVGNIILGKGNIALYRALRIETKLPTYGTYCIVLLITDLKDGLYGRGRVVNTLNPLKLFPKGYPLREASRYFSLKHVPEAVEVIDGNAFFYFPLNNWVGFKGIRDALLCAKNV